MVDAKSSNRRRRKATDPDRGGGYIRFQSLLSRSPGRLSLSGRVGHIHLSVSGSGGRLHLYYWREKEKLFPCITYIPIESHTRDRRLAVFIRHSSYLLYVLVYHSCVTTYGRPHHCIESGVQWGRVQSCLHTFQRYIYSQVVYMLALQSSKLPILYVNPSTTTILSATQNV